jgi:DNA-binding MarR family transcriptional regulator
VTGFADRAGTKPPAASLLIDRLVHSGYIERRQDEEDRRRVIIELSSKGRSCSSAFTRNGQRDCA